jgi:polyketide cyclase/dehydrase/lipid transport protein
MIEFTIVRKVGLPVEKIWALCGDFAKSPGPGVRIYLEARGNPSAQGVGAERTIAIGQVRVRERLIAVDPLRSYTYTILSGSPMKSHFAKAEFIPRGASTEIRWDVTFIPKIPGTGWIVGMVTKKAVNRYIDEIEKASSCAEENCNRTEAVSEGYEVKQAGQLL